MFCKESGVRETSDINIFAKGFCGQQKNHRGNIFFLRANVTRNYGSPITTMVMISTPPPIVRF